MSKSCIKLKADSQKNQTASINENLQQNMNNYRTTRATWYCLQYTVTKQYSATAEKPRNTQYHCDTLLCRKVNETLIIKLQIYKVSLLT